MKLWGGRFDKDPDPGFIEFSSSVSFDVRLFPYDIECTRAWTVALERAGVIGSDDAESITGALENIEGEFKNGTFETRDTDEDIHTAIERRLVELIGSTGGKVRTGRSRNDQVATDMRLLVMDACRTIASGVKKLQVALLDKSEENIDVAVPGHTHLQQAQPVLLAHSLLAFFHMIERDLELLRCAESLSDSMPLGSGALAGTPLHVDRQELADRLGFSRISQNSIDAVCDRDFISAAMFAMSSIMTHLSRLSEQVILWCSDEFKIAKLDDSWATGSSLMPQKKNPDGFELIRGKAGRVIGGMVGFMTVMKGLPLAYNRDLQEDKESFFDAFDTVSGSLHVIERSVATMSFNGERALEVLDGGFTCATDLADYLVSKGLTFPEAHKVVGEVVSYCLDSSMHLGDLSADELKQFSTLVDDGVTEWISVRASIERRSVTGGTAPAAVSKQIEEARRIVGI